MGKSSKNPKIKNKEGEKTSFWARLFVRKGWGQVILLPILSVFTALVIGGIIIALSNLEVLTSWGKFFSHPWDTLAITWNSIKSAYVAMFEGSFGKPVEMMAAIRTWLDTGTTKQLVTAFRPFSESLVISTPYIFAGLGVALGFRCNLFNIGAEGQMFIGAITSVFIGYSVTGLPFYIHMPLAILGGVAAAGLWGAIPGFLKGFFGAHEVINTMMMNYVALRFTDFLLTGPMMRPDKVAITPEILKTAYLPALFPSPMRVHWGFLIALGAAVLVYLFLWKTPIGMEIRMVGANPRAARYAGVKNKIIIVLTLTLSAALAGMAGVSQILGVDHRLVRSFSSGYGFDAIALALLGNSHPFGVVLASLLFGFLRGGAARMQSVAGTPVELIRVIQGMVIIFIAAPEIIRGLYHLRAKQKKGPVVAEQLKEGGIK
ncbi:MAG: ABC transporter permease [Anaerolineaceae bacterium]